VTASGASEAQRLYEQTRAALASNGTAAAWREVLGSCEEVARDLAVREDLGSILAYDQTAWDAERAQALRESVTLRQYYNSLSDLEDADIVGPEASELYLRSIQRIYLIIAAWQEGREHMLRALALIAPDIVAQGREYIQQGASWYDSNKWWLLPAVGLLGVAYVVRTFKR
jgi:hypothetical protein